MSGGGVFDTETGHFFGIHCARKEETLQLKAISVRIVKQRLYRCGYEPVSKPARNRKKRFLVGAAVLAPILVLACIAVWWMMRPEEASGLPEKIFFRVEDR